MATRIVVKEHIATVHVTLTDVAARNGRTAGTAVPGEFPEIFTPTVGDPEGLRADLETALTNKAARLLGSDAVSVEVNWKRGSLEVAAVLRAGTIAADVGAFLGGLAAVREAFAERIHEGVSDWLGRDVARNGVLLEAGPGLLRGKADPAEESEAAAGKASFRELLAYALMSLAVLIVIGALVVIGLKFLT